MFGRAPGRGSALAFAVGALFLPFGCAGRPAPHPHPSATSPAKPAVKAPECIVLGATTEPLGQAAERAWLREHFPGGREKEQSLGQGLPPENRVYDDVVMVDAAGIEHRICFDITAWFGKF